MPQAHRILLVHQFGLPAISGLTVTVAELARLIPQLDSGISASVATYEDFDPAGLLDALDREHRATTCVIGLNLHIEVGWQHTVALAGWCSRNEIPLNVYVHDYWPHHRTMLSVLTGQFAARVLAITPKIVTDLAVDGFDAVLVPAGVAVPEYPPIRPRVSRDQPTVGVVGRLVPRKRFPDVVASYCIAAAEMEIALEMLLPPSLVYEVDQDDEQISDINRILSECHPSATVMVDRSPSLGVDYSRWSIYVSAAEYEGLSMTPIEAILQGCPVLLSDISPHRNIVDALLPDSQAQVLFSVGDRGHLATLLRDELLTQSRRFEIHRRRKRIHEEIKARWSLANTARELISIAEA